MTRKLESDNLRSDLAALTDLLDQRSEDEDPVGWLQLTSRRRQVESELEALEQTVETTASVAVYFGGRPTFGSRGILADFGGQALEQFQSIVSTQYAALDRPIGSRGPLPQKERAQLMVTDIARGSFGFVLEEANSEGELVNTAVKNAVSAVADLLLRISSADDEAFEAAAEAVDDRVLASLTAFVKLIDGAGATLRIVEDERDLSLPREALERARERTENLAISTKRTSVRGTLYLLPDARRFELHPADGGESLKGTIQSDLLATLVDPSGNVQTGIIGRTWNAELDVREVRVRSREPRYSYKLTGITDR